MKNCKNLLKILIINFCFSAEGENWEDTPSTELVLRWSNIHTVIAKIVAVMPM